MTPPTTISCLRCTDLGRECCVRRSITDIICRSTYLCIECDAAGIDTCVFPPSLRHLRRIKSACSSCMHVHHKCIFVDDHDTQCIRCTKRGLLCVFELNGRCRSPIAHSNWNPPPPSWIRIFKANTSTSRRTQAAVMACTIPSSITNCNITAIDLCSSTTAKRRMKLDLYMAKVSVPYCFTTLAAKYADEMKNNIALVCDGGIENCIPPFPPPSKVKPLTTRITK